MKRIALTWYDMVDAGLPTALHLNGRTDFDFVRWGQFARRQHHLRAVAFEFLTGAATTEDGRRYVERLKLFVKESGRDDLLLVLRGGQRWLAELRQHFGQVLLIDSGAYFKTVNRQRTEFSIDGRLVYRSHKTRVPSDVRALFHHNVKARLAVHAGLSTAGGQQQPGLFQDPPKVAPERGSTKEPDGQLLLEF